MPHVKETRLNYEKLQDGYQHYCHLIHSDALPKANLEQLLINNINPTSSTNKATYPYL